MIIYAGSVGRFWRLSFIVFGSAQSFNHFGRLFWNGGGNYRCPLSDVYWKTQLGTSTSEILSMIMIGVSVAPRTILKHWKTHKAPGTREWRNELTRLLLNKCWRDWMLRIGRVGRPQCDNIFHVEKPLYDFDSQKLDDKNTIMCIYIFFQGGCLSFSHVLLSALDFEF